MEEIFWLILHQIIQGAFAETVALNILTLFILDTGKQVL